MREGRVSLRGRWCEKTSWRGSYYSKKRDLYYSEKRDLYYSEKRDLYYSEMF